MKHATVVKDGFVVPLIGIPEDAVLERCESCNKEHDIQQVRLVEGKMLCDECVKSKAPSQT